MDSMKQTTAMKELMLAAPSPMPEKMATISTIYTMKNFPCLPMRDRSLYIKPFMTGRLSFFWYRTA